MRCQGPHQEISDTIASFLGEMKFRVRGRCYSREKISPLSCDTRVNVVRKQPPTLTCPVMSSGPSSVCRNIVLCHLTGTISEAKDSTVSGSFHSESATQAVAEQHAVCQKQDQLLESLQPATTAAARGVIAQVSARAGQNLPEEARRYVAETTRFTRSAVKMGNSFRHTTNPRQQGER